MDRVWGHGGQTAGVEPSGAVCEDCRGRLWERSPWGRGALGAGTWRSITGAFCIYWVTCCISFKTPGLYRVFPWGGSPSQPYPLGTGVEATTICRVNKCILGKCHFGDKGWKSRWIPELGEGGCGFPGQAFCRQSHPGPGWGPRRGKPQYLARLGSTSVDHRSMPPARLTALENPMERRKPTARALRMP